MNKRFLITKWIFNMFKHKINAPPESTLSYNHNNNNKIMDKLS